MVTSTQSGISSRTTTYAAREMLKAALPVIILDRFGQPRQMPQNKGVQIKFRRPIPYTAKTTPLVEGVTPSESSFAYEDVTATLAQYGDVSSITDVIANTHEDPVLNDMSEQMGLNVGRTIELLTYNGLKAGTNVFYANGSSRGAVNTPVTLDRLRAVSRALRAQKAQTLTRMVAASTNYATAPVDRCYPVVGHTDLDADIRNIPGFVPTASYGQRTVLHETEIGSVESFRFFLSPDLPPWADAGGAKVGAYGEMLSTTGTSADVYPLLVFGQDAYGTVPLRGAGSIDPTIIPVGDKTKDDPLGQRGFVGWKTWFAVVILNQLWMARLEVAATKL